MAEQQDTDKSQHRCVRLVDVILFCMTNATSFAACYVLGILVYRAGRHNESEPFILGALVVLVWFVGLCAMLVRMLRVWRRSRTSERILRLGAIAATIGLVALLRTLPRPEGYLEGLRDYVLSRTNIAQVREWANAHPGFIANAKVCGLREAYVHVSTDGQEIHLQWGGGFQTSRSLTIVPPSKNLPQVGTRLDIAPGASVATSVN